MGVRILRTNHTSFTVSDLDRTLAFFRDALGFEVLSKAPRSPDMIRQVTGVDGAEVIIAYVQGPGHRVELIEYSGPKDRRKVEVRPCDVGFAHLAFDVEDIEAAIRACEAHDLRPAGAIVSLDRGPNKGARVVYLRDPDGLTIEFIQAPPG
jgi:catechol 2,3-dioxygenase-like lactoylglutathione lyase family enzyme